MVANPDPIAFLCIAKLFRVRHLAETGHQTQKSLTQVDRAVMLDKRQE